MKTYKTSQKLSSNPNYEKYQQSDIFIQKGLNKPEIKYTHKRFIPKKTFDSSYNFLEWKDMSPHTDETIKIKLNPNNISQILNSNTEKYLNYDLNKIGSKKKHKTFYEKMYEDEPQKNINKSSSMNKNLNKRYQKETMFLGDYNGEEYKIKKNKTKKYELPLNYLKQENPLKIKMDQIYGGNDDLIGNYKPINNLKNKLEHSSSSIGYIKKEFETNNDRDNKIVSDPKKMKYFAIYGNNGIENANKKLNPMAISRSTNSVYTPGVDCTKNRINFLRSNIFYDKEIDQKNNEDGNIKNKNNNYKTIKVNRHLRNKRIKKRSNSTSNLINRYYNKINNENNNNFNTNININNNNNSEINLNNIEKDLLDIKNNSRKFLYKTNGEDNLPIKLDWKDAKFYLLFPQNKNRDILKKNSRQRKFKNLYNTEPIIPKEKLGQEFKSDKRKEVENMTKNYYKDINYSKMKKICDNISQYQILDNNHKEEIKEPIHYNNDDIKTNTYEIVQIKNRYKCNLINKEEIKKKFAKKGIHIYNIEENMDSIMNNKNMNSIKFKIRENQKDEKVIEKINQIKKDFIKDNILMKQKMENKKEKNDIIPKTLNWSTPHCDLLTKNKRLANTNDGVTHLKGKRDNNGEEKITRIHVNLKYKNTNINN